MESCFAESPESISQLCSHISQRWGQGFGLDVRPGRSRAGQLVGGLPHRHKTRPSPVWGAGKLGWPGLPRHLHCPPSGGHGAWPAAQGAEGVQWPGWRHVALTSPRKPGSHCWSVRALRPAQTKGRDTGVPLGGAEQEL